MTTDKHCYECKVRYKDPKPQDLVMYLHAWKYKVSYHLSRNMSRIVPLRESHESKEKEQHSESFVDSSQCFESYLRHDSCDAETLSHLPPKIQCVYDNLNLIYYSYELGVTFEFLIQTISTIIMPHQSLLTSSLQHTP
jgi:hypothetical protein